MHCVFAPCEKSNWDTDNNGFFSAAQKGDFSQKARSAKIHFLRKCHCVFAPVARDQIWAQRDNNGFSAAQKGFLAKAQRRKEFTFEECIASSRL